MGIGMGLALLLQKVQKDCPAAGGSQEACREPALKTGLDFQDGMGNAAFTAAGLLIDLIPIIGDIKDAYECTADPSVLTCGAAVAGIIPIAGDMTKIVLKQGDQAVTIIKDGDKVISSAAARADEIEAAANRRPDDLISGGRHRSTDDVNAEFPIGYSPPYTPGTQVTEFVSDGSQNFVRVVSGDIPGGQWIMRASDIEGLSPQQIANKFALPEVPTGITSITPPAGTRIRTGEVNPNFGGAGGGIQFQLLDYVNEGWANVTRLP